jgi:hypothetical protein
MHGEDNKYIQIFCRNTSSHLEVPGVNGKTLKSIGSYGNTVKGCGLD